LFDAPPLRDFDDVARLGEEVKRRGFRALKTGLLAFDETARRNPQAAVDVIRGAFATGMRDFTFNLDSNDFVRITGYLVRKSDLARLATEGARQRFAYSADSGFTQRVGAVGVGYRASDSWRVGAGFAFSLMDLRLVQTASDRIADATELRSLLVSARDTGSAFQVRAQSGVTYVGVCGREPGQARRRRTARSWRERAHGEGRRVPVRGARRPARRARLCRRRARLPLHGARRGPSKRRRHHPRQTTFSVRRTFRPDWAPKRFRI
jgi:hypothetical protein